MNKGKFNLRKNLHFKHLILLHAQCKQSGDKQSFKLTVNGLYIIVMYMLISYLLNVVI